MTFMASSTVGCLATSATSFSSALPCFKVSTISAMPFLCIAAIFFFFSSVSSVTGGAGRCSAIWSFSDARYCSRVNGSSIGSVATIM